jgi:hypothetical protein
MPEKFLAIEDFELKKGQESFLLKKGKSYTKKELIKFLEKEGTLNFKLKCTKLKNALVDINQDVKELLKTEPSKEIAEEPSKEIAEEIIIEAEMMFLVNKQIKQKNKILFKKDQKIAISELKDLDVAKLVEEGFLTEIKISKETENKD